MVEIALAIALSPPDCLLRHELAHAGGWGANHPNAIYTSHCGQLPMPPHRFPLHGIYPRIHYVSIDEVQRHCSFFIPVQACSDIGGKYPDIWLPAQ